MIQIIFDSYVEWFSSLKNNSLKPKKVLDFSVTIIVKYFMVENMLIYNKRMYNPKSPYVVRHRGALLAKLQPALGFLFGALPECPRPGVKSVYPQSLHRSAQAIPKLRMGILWNGKNEMIVNVT